MMSSSSSDDLALAFNQNKELKESLRQCQESYQELKYECNFNVAKASELREIVEARTTDQIYEKLMTKSLQNAELSLELDKVQMELHNAKTEMGRMVQERDASKRLLLEMSDIVRTLSAVPIHYEKIDVKMQGVSPQDISLKNIKRKIEAIMADRQHAFHTCESLKEENAAQQQKIMALESKFHMLNTARSEDASDKIHRYGEDYVEQKTNRQELIDPVCSSTVSCSSGWSSLEAEKISTFDEADKEEMENLKSQLEEMSERYERLKNEKGSSKEKEIRNLNIQLRETTEKYEQLKNECQTVLLKMEVAERQLEESDAEVESMRNKRDAYKVNLRDVIDQYKQLHKLYDASVARIEDLETMSSILRDEKQILSKEKDDLISEQEAWIKEKEEMAEENTTLTNERDALFEEKSTLIEEKGNLFEEMDNLIEEKEALIAEKDHLIAQYEDATAIATLTEERDTLVAENNTLMEEKEALRADHKRLREEMRGWIASHELHYEECRAAYVQAGSENLPALQRAYQAAIAKIAIAEQKLTMAEREVETLKKQKASKDRNLRDSISQYRKLEQEQNTTLNEIEIAQANLKKARIEADRQKEEAKHVRRRLTASLRQISQLQEEQEEAEATISEMKATRRKEWSETEWTNESRHKMLLLEASTTANAWRTRRELQAERNLLKKEKNEISAFCVDLLHEKGENEDPNILSAIMVE